MEELTRTACWAKDFDLLLCDKAGLATFTEFLKKAYCQENIYFWKKCEAYKLLSADERTFEAVRMYREHIALSSSEQINIDENTRLSVERGLTLAQPDLFHHAQKHIYMMLQQDAYRRFLVSDLYKQAVLSETEQRPFTFNGEKVQLITVNEMTKKKSRRSIGGSTIGGSTESKRRTSCIPIPSRSSSKNKNDKKLAAVTLPTSGDKPEKKSTLKTKKNMALPVVEKKEKSSENATSKGLFGFLRRRSLGETSKHSSITQPSLASPTAKKSRLPTTRQSRMTPTSITGQGGSISNVMPSILESNFGDPSQATYHHMIQNICKEENWSREIQPFRDDNDHAMYTRAAIVLRRRTVGHSPDELASSNVRPSSNTHKSSSTRSYLGVHLAFWAEQRLTHIPENTEVGYKKSSSVQQPIHRSESVVISPALPPPRRHQFISSTSSIAATGAGVGLHTDADTDFSDEEKQTVSFFTRFQDENCKTKKFGRYSVDSAVVSKELEQLRCNKVIRFRESLSCDKTH